MPAPKSQPEIELLEEMQRFLQTAVHDLRAAQRRTGTAAELLLQAGDEEREVVAAQVLQGLAKTDELLTGIGRYATALAPGSYKIHLFPSISAVRFALTHLEREIRET